MKRLGSLFLAAVLGSISTVATFQWFDKDKDNVKLEYAKSVPSSRVAYVDKNGTTTAVPVDFTAAAEKVTPAIVHIRSTSSGNARSDERTRGEEVDPFREFFGGPRAPQGPSQSAGSGVIINPDGYIVTNNHVVADADVVEVTLTDNRSYKAEVIGTDPDTDLALIKIGQKGLPSLAFVDSDKAKVGEWVLAVGNPFNLTSTVTAGIISAKGRSINILSRGDNQLGSTAIESFIQTDAAINPGNSGGALVNLDGGLLGINTAIASPTGSYSGYGFAVPSDIVSKVVEDLLQYGTVQRGWLGVSIASVNSQLAKEKDLNINEGAYISGFADKSSAKEAGLKEGDVIIKIDEARIRTNTALIEYIGRHRPGDKVMITVDRGGKEVTVPVTLKNKDGQTSVVKVEPIKGSAALGASLEDLDTKTLKKLEINNGVRVKSLGNGILSRYTEMHDGFIITRVNDIAVKSVKEFNELLQKKKSGELVILSGIYEDYPREFNYAFRM